MLIGDYLIFCFKKVGKNEDLKGGNGFIYFNLSINSHQIPNHQISDTSNIYINIILIYWPPPAIQIDPIFEWFLISVYDALEHQ